MDKDAFHQFFMMMCQQLAEEESKRGLELEGAVGGMMPEGMVMAFVFRGEGVVGTLGTVGTEGRGGKAMSLDECLALQKELDELDVPFSKLFSSTSI